MAIKIQTVCTTFNEEFKNIHMNKNVMINNSQDYQHCHRKDWLQHCAYCGAEKLCEYLYHF